MGKQVTENNRTEGEREMTWEELVQMVNSSEGEFLFYIEEDGESGQK